MYYLCFIIRSFFIVSEVRVSRSLRYFRKLPIMYIARFQFIITFFQVSCYYSSLTMVLKLFKNELITSHKIQTVTCHGVSYKSVAAAERRKVKHIPYFEYAEYQYLTITHKYRINIYFTSNPNQINTIS